MLTKDVPTMPNSVTMIRTGRQLSRDPIAPTYGDDAGAIYAVRLQRITQEEADEFTRTRERVQAGLAALEAGDVYSEEEAVRIIRGDD